MVETSLEPEVVQILEHIKNGKNFLLSGGAGSGKTYSLVQVIKKVIINNPAKKIACITYTNTAVKEIEKRVDHNNLIVSTIHDFLWDNIKSFKEEIKKSLVALLNNSSSGIKNPEEEGVVDSSYFNEIKEGIQYKEYLQIKKGVISHDEVLILANFMFAYYPKLGDILKDKFKFIFIDEYQDTSSIVVEIFLKHLNQGLKKNIIGFFGDSMQSIYPDGVGDLNQYIASNDVVEILKKQNRRNPQLVIDLANKLRIDGLQQESSTDKNAPNMLDGNIKQGRVKFLYSSRKSLDEIKTTSYFTGWDFCNSKETKELNLTHNIIAQKAGFNELMEIYDKDPIIGLKKDVITKIKSDKLILEEKITFDEVVDQVQLTKGRGSSKVLRKNILLEDPHTKLLYEELASLPFSIVKKIYFNKDSLIDNKRQNEDDRRKKGSKRDKLISHLFKIQNNIHLYKSKQYNEFLRKTEYKINSISDKQKLKDAIIKLSEMSEYTIEDVINIADSEGICKKDDSLNQFICDSFYLYNRIKMVKYQEFKNLYDYLEGFTPFSTQHKIKGAEFDNVLVVLNNGGWNSSYNFKMLFGEGKVNDNVLKKTQKIFYVCCTRAKENLIVFFDSPEDTIIAQAQEWFGEGNVHEIR